jgi:hypothetical protein
MKTEVQRFAFEYDLLSDCYCAVAPDPQGRFVDYADYERLEKELSLYCSQFCEAHQPTHKAEGIVCPCCMTVHLAEENAELRQIINRLENER